MLEVKNVTKKYGNFLANDNISFTVPEKSISLLVGPNGAGKSTILKSIMGLLRYQGEIVLNGESTISPAAKQKLAYVPEFPQMYSLLTVYEHMEYIARVYKLHDWQEDANNLLSRFEMLDNKDKFGGALSKGMQQKLSICTAMLHKPQFILFDEPMIGLDPHAIKEVKNLFYELKENECSLLISTHILDTVDDLWNRVEIMDHGKIAASMSHEELKAAGKSLEKYFFEITEQGQFESSEPEISEAL